MTDSKNKNNKILKPPVVDKPDGAIIPLQTCLLGSENNEKAQTEEITKHKKPIKESETLLIDSKKELVDYQPESSKLLDLMSSSELIVDKDDIKTIGLVSKFLYLNLSNFISSSKSIMLIRVTIVFIVFALLTFLSNDKLRIIAFCIPALLLYSIIEFVSFWSNQRKIATDLDEIQWWARDTEEVNHRDTEEVNQKKKSKKKQSDQLLSFDLISLELGYGLIPLVDEEQDGELLERIRAIRRQFAQEMGMIVPCISIKDDLQLKPGGYVIFIKGAEIARGELMVGYYLALYPGEPPQKIEGIPTKEPTFNLPALWISRNKKEEAQELGYTVVNLSSIIGTHLCEIIRNHIDEFLGWQETQKLLSHLSQTDPIVVNE